jgi:hypothetical protein
LGKFHQIFAPLSFYLSPAIKLTRVQGAARIYTAYTHTYTHTHRVHDGKRERIFEGKERNVERVRGRERE